MITPSRFYETLPASAVKAFLKWADFLYKDVEFNMPDSPLHARAHCERVLLHALTMAVREFGEDDAEALEILAQASVFHDTRRQDEYLDTGHGARAAVYYTDFCRASEEKVKFHPETVLLMRYHDLDDSCGIEAIRKEFPESHDRVEKLYAVFKDADALDRWRLGRRGLDEKFLRTPSSRRLVESARQLVIATMDPEILAYFDDLIEKIHNEKSVEE